MDVGGEEIERRRRGKKGRERGKEGEFSNVCGVNIKNAFSAMLPRHFWPLLLISHSEIENKAG